MKKWIMCSLIIGAFLGLIFHADASDAAKKCELLQVQGTKIVNSKGKTVNLRGVSTHGIAWFPQYVNKKAFRSFRKNGGHTIRLAIYSDPVPGYQKSLYSKVEEGVKAATDLGMYVILDWHILSDGNPRQISQKQKNFLPIFRKNMRHRQM